MPESISKPLVIWLITDGKPGHENQSRGLAESLARLTSVQIFVVPAPSVGQMLAALLLRHSSWTTALPDPNLILGAGHATHLTLLAARRVRGGCTVVLMKPSLPRVCFDLCLLPAHDGVAADARTMVTEGALNRIQMSDTLNPNQGLILLGGISPHFVWNNDSLALQIQSLLARTPQMQWTISDSRRTPADFLAQLPPHPNLQLISQTATPPNWLPAQLALCGIVWVTPDSASMVFEALTSGADVGVFDLAVNPRSRVGWTIARLADAQRITRFVSWCASGTLHPNRHPLAEADRCARWILEWLKKKN